MAEDEVARQLVAVPGIEEGDVVAGRAEDVAGLVASTANIDAARFMAGGTQWKTLITAMGWS